MSSSGQDVPYAESHSGLCDKQKIANVDASRGKNAQHREEETNIIQGAGNAQNKNMNGEEKNGGKEGNTVCIDGSVFEGGGQIIRNALAYSAILHIPVEVFNIRANRQNPGLAPQHLQSVELIQRICRGNLTGGHLRSIQVKLQPNEIEGGEFFADPKTAGSITLMMQSSILPLSFAKVKSHMSLRGGTDVSFSPPISFFDISVKQLFEKMGIRFDMQINRRGFFPKGCGEVHVDVFPLKEPIKSIEILDRGVLCEISGFAYTAGAVSQNVGHDLVSSCKMELKKLGVLGKQIRCDISHIHFDNKAAFGSGWGLNIYGRSSTGCIFFASKDGQKHASAKQTATNCAEELFKEMSHNGCVDTHMQDQLILLMSLAKGTSYVLTGPITLHTKTAIFVAEKMTNAKFKIYENPAEAKMQNNLTISSEFSNDVPTLIECEGIGFFP